MLQIVKLSPLMRLQLSCVVVLILVDAIPILIAAHFEQRIQKHPFVSLCQSECLLLVLLSLFFVFGAKFDELGELFVVGASVIWVVCAYTCDFCDLGFSCRQCLIFIRVESD